MLGPSLIGSRVLSQNQKRNEVSSYFTLVTLFPCRSLPYLAFRINGCLLVLAILDDAFNIVACYVWFCFLSVKCMFSCVKTSSSFIMDVCSCQLIFTLLRRIKLIFVFVLISSECTICIISSLLIDYVS